MTGRQTLLAILVLAAVLRIIGANAEMWSDEIATVRRYVQLPLLDIATRYERANNHVLYSLLSHMAVRLLGAQPWVVRLPSILFGIAGVWAFWFVAVRLWSARIVMLGTLLFALSYHHVHYTQNARGYSAFLFFALLATGLLLRLLDENSLGRKRLYGLGYAIAIGLGAYSLLITVCVMAGHACALLATRRWGALGWLTAGGIFALLLYSPLAMVMFAYYFEHRYGTGHSIFSTAFFRELAPLVPLLAVATVVAPPLVIRFGRRQPMAAALLFLPLAFNVALPVLRGQGVHPRTFILGLPVGYYMLMEAMDWAWPRFRLLSLAGAAGVAALSLTLLVRFYPLPKQGYQRALSYIELAAASGDERIGLGMAGRSARFYDPSIRLINTGVELDQWMKHAPRRAWVLYTFPRQLRETEPRLYDWVQRATARQASFPGVIEDGTVHVHLWEPNLRSNERP